MNKHLYEALYYKLQGDKITAISALEHLMVEEPFCQSETIEEAEQLLAIIIQTEARLHELMKRYKTRHESALPADQERAQDAQRWAELSGRLAGIEDHLSPSTPPARAEPLTHEDLLVRSSTYRESQQVGPGVVIAEVEEE